MEVSNVEEELFMKGWKINFNKKHPIEPPHLHDVLNVSGCLTIKNAKELSLWE